MNPLLGFGERLVIGHRGAPTLAPENTIESFRIALDQGADAVEMDVQLSADGVPVVIHDADLRRTTNHSGAVSALSVETIQQADAGARFTPDGGCTYPWKGRNVRVPTLDEVLTALPGVPILLELKTAAVQDAVRRAILDHDAAQWVIPVSAHDAALTGFRAGPFRYGASSREIGRLYWGSMFGMPPRKVRHALLSVPHRYNGLLVPSARFLRAARRLGTPVHVWTVDDPLQARHLWARGAAGIVTNVPRKLVKARGEL